MTTRALLFSHGFRPLFLLAVLHALGSMLFWLCAWTGIFAVSWSRIPAYWHGHEMLMGLAAAAMGGILLTVVGSWTGRPSVTGASLILLCITWIAGRLAISSPIVAAIADGLYWLILWALIARESASAHPRDLKVLAILTALALSDAAFHAAELASPVFHQQALWAMIWLVIILLDVIGGRVIPACTVNSLRPPSPEPYARRLPAPFSKIDMAAIIALSLFALVTVVRVPFSLGIATGTLATILQIWRLAHWKVWRADSEPLIWTMHLSSLWIPIGTALWTASLAGLLPVTAAVHALTVGAISSMVISIGARAALVHTARPLVSHPLLTASVALLSLAAALRIAAVLSPLPALLHSAGAAWMLAFTCFGWRYIPILMTPVQELK